LASLELLMAPLIVSSGFKTEPEEATGLVKGGLSG
jgi:hypothetical protein